jgi:hypothetical protein
MKTVEEAARALGLSVHTLNGWRVKGWGPEYIKMHGAIRYSDAAIEAFKGKCARQSTSQAAA